MPLWCCSTHFLEASYPLRTCYIPTITHVRVYGISICTTCWYTTGIQSILFNIVFANYPVVWIDSKYFFVFFIHDSGLEFCVFKVGWFLALNKPMRYNTYWDRFLKLFTKETLKYHLVTWNTPGYWKPQITSYYNALCNLVSYKFLFTNNKEVYLLWLIGDCRNSFDKTGSTKCGKVWIWIGAKNRNKRLEVKCVNLLALVCNSNKPLLLLYRWPGRNGTYLYGEFTPCQKTKKI